VTRAACGIRANVAGCFGYIASVRCCARYDGGSAATNEQTRRPQPPTRSEHVGGESAAARRMVHLLLGHALVDEARRALRLVLRVVPSARPSAARSGALGAGARAERRSAVGSGWGIDSPGTSFWLP
jgi:hypothetical protein